MTYRFELLIKGDKALGPRFASIYLKKYSGDKEGRVFVTPEMTIAEIDETIDNLISELNEIRGKAKRELG